MPLTFTNQQGVARNDGPTQFAGIIPTQPILGDRAVTTAGEFTFFEYDVISPYGVGASQANIAQTTRLMVGWGLTVAIALLCSTDMFLRIYINSGVNTTFTQIISSPISVVLNTKWQTFVVGPLPAAAIRGTLQAQTSNSTVEYHVRLLP